MSHTGRKGRQDPPSDKVTYSESIIVVNPNDEGVGTSNNTGTFFNDGSKSTLINIDDFIPEDIKQKKRVYNHNDSTLIDIDAVVEANMKSNVHNDDNNNTNKDDDNKNLIDADDDIEHQGKKDGTNSTDNTDNTSVESTNQKDRRHNTDDIPYNLGSNVYEIHNQAEDVEEVEEGETSVEHWCDCGILWVQTCSTICGLCRKGGSQRQRLYRWIMAIAVFAIASGSIGAVVAKTKPKSGSGSSLSTSGSGSSLSTEDSPNSGSITDAPTGSNNIIVPQEIVKACTFFQYNDNSGNHAICQNAVIAPPGTYDPIEGATIPTEIGLLTMLTSLNMANPDVYIGDYYVDINSSSLNGPIPSTIGELQQLQYLSFYGNGLLTGMIPTSITSLTNLESLYLSATGLGDTIPSTIGNLQMLKELSFYYSTSLKGTIPATIVNIRQLTYLDLSVTGISGTIPPSLGSLTELKHLDLSNTVLTGTIPTEFQDLTQLTYLDLLDTSLIDTIPSSFGMLANLLSLEFPDGVSGSFPSELGSLTQLTYLKFNENVVTGTIPSVLCRVALEIDVYCSSYTNPNLVCCP